MILVKGDRVAFATEGRDPTVPDKYLPRTYGIIHDPEGAVLPRCVAYFGPYRRVRGAAKMTPAARAYFGAQYEATPVAVDRPRGGWRPVARVTTIFYVRPGKHAGGYHHRFRRGAPGGWIVQPFRLHPLTLERAGSFYRVILGSTETSGCLLDDRGFVFP